MEVDNEKQSQKSNREAEDDQLRSGLQILPRDTTLDILSRLPITSLVQFSFVNRAWHLLAHDPSLVELHYSKSAKKNPCLIFHCDYPIRNLLYFAELSDQPGNEIVRRIQTPFQEVMPEFHVLASCNGLLCLSDSLYGDPIYIYNPFTREHKELPRSRQFDDQQVVYGFGFNPTFCEYKVVKMVFFWMHWNQYVSPPGRFRNRRLRIHGSTGSEVQVCSLDYRRSHWRSIGKAPYKVEGRASEALVNGRLHWLTKPEISIDLQYLQRIRRIISFDLGDERFREVPRPKCGVLDRPNYHLAVLGGCLSAVICSHYVHYEIWIMREYGVKESWVREFCIENHSPHLMKPMSQKPDRIWRNVLNQRPARVLCLLKNGNILIEYKGGVLVSHDPATGQYEKLLFQGLPDTFETVVHVGSLNWIDTLGTSTN
ncbi:hypothetical protein NMG60_11035305 [Bertholletia excelsa]